MNNDDWKIQNCEIIVQQSREDIADLQWQIRERQRMIRFHMQRSFKAQRQLLKLQSGDTK